MKRRLLKLVGYKTGSFILALLATYIFTGEIFKSLELSGIITIIVSAWYYFWDWLWEKKER